MKREQIYVTIDTEEKRLRAIEILRNAGGEICEGSSFLYPYHHEMQICFEPEFNEWGAYNCKGKTRITLDQLESLLLPNYQVKDVILSLDELKQQAEKLGFDLVEKPYEPKVGDFGVFWDRYEENTYYGFLINTDDSKYPMMSNNRGWFKNFRKLTEEEKQKIQEAW
jgi:hypothetical protein